MTAILYTSSNSVRAAIGLTQDEIADSLFVDLNVEDQLLVYLGRVYPTHRTLKVEYDADSADEGLSDKMRALKLLCQYQAAVIVLQAGQNLIFQTVTNGGTTASRFSKDDLETTLARMEGMRDAYASELLDEDETPELEGLVGIFVAVKPCYDPVRGW